MANESISFLSSFNKYIFSSQPVDNLFLSRPYKWAVSVHDSVNNPTGAVLDNSWYSDPAKRKSIAAVTQWVGLNGDFKDGISNNSIISFDYVPTGQTWILNYYIVWGISEVGGVDTFYPIYTGTFPSPITLNELQILQFPVNTFRITP